MKRARPKLDRPAAVDKPLSLDRKYRPVKLEDVFGQRHIIKSLQSVVRSANVPHAFMFTGPSGVGKTTLARILAREFECNVVEVDAASNSGIDSVRNLVQMLQYKDLDHPTKMLIVDEAHALSKQAWQALLKPIEEPKAHVFYCLCTTDAHKVPATIKTRCASYELTYLSDAEIEEMLGYVLDQEGKEIDDDHLDAIIEACEGSARMALSLLMKTYFIDGGEAVSLIRSGSISLSEDSAAIIEVCRAFVNAKSWKEVSHGVTACIQEENVQPETIRQVMISYMLTMLKDRPDGIAIDGIEALGSLGILPATKEGQGRLLARLGQFYLD